MLHVGSARAGRQRGWQECYQPNPLAITNVTPGAASVRYRGWDSVCM
jgi:hypothetical protein